MAKANPKKWFPSRFLASIRFRKVDKLAERLKIREPYFDTWEEAHAQAVDWAASNSVAAGRSLETAKRAIKSAAARIKKVAAMTNPIDD